MNLDSRIAPALVAAAILSLTSISPVLAVSQSSGLTIRITRPSAATVTLAANPLTANGVSASLTPSDSRGTASLCAATTTLDVVPSLHDCISWTGGVAIAFALPLDALLLEQPDLDVVATAS